MIIRHCKDEEGGTRIFAGRDMDVMWALGERGREGGRDGGREGSKEGRVGWMKGRKEGGRERNGKYSHSCTDFHALYIDCS